MCCTPVSTDLVWLIAGTSWPMLEHFAWIYSNASSVVLCQLEAKRRLPWRLSTIRTLPSVFRTRGRTTPSCGCFLKYTTAGGPVSISNCLPITGRPRCILWLIAGNTVSLAICATAITASASSFSKRSLANKLATVLGMLVHIFPHVLASPFALNAALYSRVGRDRWYTLMDPLLQGNENDILQRALMALKMMHAVEPQSR